MTLPHGKLGRESGSKFRLGTHPACHGRYMDHISVLAGSMAKSRSRCGSVPHFPHAFARRFHFPDNGRIVLIAGMAAGFGGLFQTPFAAVFFAMEVVVSGSMAYSALLPAAIASFTASATSHALGLEKFSVLLSQTLSLTDTKTVTYLISFWNLSV